MSQGIPMVARPPLPPLRTWTVLDTEGDYREVVAHDIREGESGSLAFIQFFYPTNLHKEPSFRVTKVFAAGRWLEFDEPVPEQRIVTDDSGSIQ